MKFSENQIKIAKETFERNGFAVSQQGVRDAQAYLADNLTMYKIGAMSVSDAQNYDEVDWAQLILAPMYFGIKPVMVKQGKPISDNHAKVLENVVQEPTVTDFLFGRSAVPPSYAKDFFNF